MTIGKTATYTIIVAPKAALITIRVEMLVEN